MMAGSKGESATAMPCEGRTGDRLPSRATAPDGALRATEADA